MPKVLPLYILSGLVAVAAIYAGLTGKKVFFITTPRSAVIVLTAAGFLMCTFGAITIFVNKSPASYLTIAGYILGALAVLVGITQIFNLKLPVISDPKNALIVISCVIIIKVVIARLNFLLPG